jgi:hypothetical protein
MTVKFAFSREELSKVVNTEDDVTGAYVTLYGSWQEGLVFRLKESDPNVGTGSEGPAFKLQKKGKTGYNFHLQVAGSRIEGAPSCPFKVFNTDHIMGGDNGELMIFPMEAATLANTESNPSDNIFVTRNTEPESTSVNMPVVTAMAIVNMFLAENPDVFVRTEDGRTHKTIELVRQEFVKL